MECGEIKAGRTAYGEKEKDKLRAGVACERVE